MNGAIRRVVPGSVRIVSTGSEHSDADETQASCSSTTMHGPPKQRPRPDLRTSFEQSFRIEPRDEYLVQNLTPELLVVKSSAEFGELVLPALGERIVSGARLAPFADALRLSRQRHEVSLRRHLEPPRWARLTSGLVGAALLVVVAYAVHDVLAHGTLRRRWFLVTAAVALLVVAVAVCWSRVVESRRRRQSRSVDAEEGNVANGPGGHWEGDETVRRTSHYFALGLVVLVGAVLPALAIAAATDLRSLATFEGGLHVEAGEESRFVSRMIQITYVAILSLFPALLYFQFDRERVGKIRHEWRRSIFRLDRHVKTLADVEAKYGHELAEGANYSTDTVRYVGFKHSPIVVATVLIALGWTMLVLRTESFDFATVTAVAQQVERVDEAERRAEEAEDVGGVDEGDDAVEGESAATDVVSEQAAADAEAARAEADALASEDGESGETTVVDDTEQTDGTDDSDTTDAGGDESAADRVAVAADGVRDAQLQVQSTGFFQLLAPDPSAAGMAFLGAYFYGIYLTLRSYFRNDLLPKLYHQISVRLITVVVVAYVINALFYRTESGNAVWVVSFLAGIVPTTVIQRLLSTGSGLISSAGWLPRAISSAFSRPRPLTQIDGIDLYDSGRLEAGGVTDVPALAQSDLVSVMVRTRLPITRIVDWADQAALMVVLGSGQDEDLDPRVEGLRMRGLRTATDFLSACDAADDAAGRQVLDECLAIRPPVVSPHAEAAASAAGPVSHHAVCNAIRRQPVMAMVEQWRRAEHADRCACDEVRVVEMSLDEPVSSP